MRRGPRSPKLGTTTDHLGKHIVTARVFVELPLELKRIVWSGIIGPYIWFWK